MRFVRFRYLRRMNLVDEELLQQLCVEQEEGTTINRFIDVFPTNLTSEEQWIDFVLKERGVDHIREFFSKNYEISYIQWSINKPLAGNTAGRTVLHIEARDQRYVVLSLLLRFGGSPNVTDAELKTPVHYAVIHNSPACLETLLEWGGDLYQRDECGKSPLDYFTCSFSSTIIDTLKQYSAGYDPLLDGGVQQIKVIRLHLMISEQEKSLDKFKELYYSCSNQEKLLCLESELSNQTLLYRACKAGWIEGVYFVLSQTVEVPSANQVTNETPLHAACEGDHYEIVVELITRYPELLLVKDKLPHRGWYPIHSACAFGASDKTVAVILVGIVRLCFDSPNLPSDISFLDSFGFSPLFMAAESNNFSHVSLFLHPTLCSALLHFAPSLLYSTSTLVPTKCSILHGAVLADNPRIIRAIMDKIPQSKMFLYIPCKLVAHEVMGLLGYYLNSYLPIPVKLCENSNGELELVSLDDITDMHTPFDQMVLSPLAIAAATGSSESVRTLLDAGMKDTNNLALRLALFMKHSEITIDLLFSQKTDGTIFKACDKSLLDFPVSPYITEHLFQCTEIDLQMNNLTEIPLSLFQIPVLKYLNLSNNNLTTLPVGDKEVSTSYKPAEWEWKCRSLENLILNSNGIHSLPEAVWTIPSLECLDASHNKLKVISPTKLYSHKLSKIDLSYNNLEEVPPFLFTAEEVNLSFNELKSLPIELWYSESIKVLNVSSNCIADICFAVQHAESMLVSFTTACTKVINVMKKVPSVGQIGTVSSLSRLKLARNKLHAFPKDLACFATHLQNLDISYNQISAIEISMLPPYLTTLIASNCRIAQFGSIMSNEELVISCTSLGIGNKCPHRAHISLQHLSNLNLSNNKLLNMNFAAADGTTSLYPELNVLNLSANELYGTFSPSVKLQSNLFSLDLSGNVQLESIPMELSVLYGSLFYLKLDNLPNLRDPPKQYHDLAVNNLLSYMRSRMERSVKHPSLRLMVFGDGKTGKTTLIERLKRRRHKAGRPSLLKHNGISVKQWSYSPSSSHGTVKFTFWEFDNQDVCEAVHHCFYSAQALYLVVFNLMNGENGVHGLEKWLLNIKVNAPKCPVIVVGTHTDQVDGKQVSSLTKFVDTLYHDGTRYPKIAAVAGVSTTVLQLKRNSDINVLRKQIYFVATHLFLKHGKVSYLPEKSPDDPSALLNQLIPQSYIDLEEAVQTKAAKMMIAKEIPILTEKEFFTSFMPSWRSDQDLNRILQYLHDRGALMYYKNYWRSHIFCIDMQWICSVVSSILFSLQACNGIISQELFFEKCTLIPKNLQSECMELLAKYEIVLNLGESRYFIPSLLPSRLHQSPLIIDAPTNTATISTVHFSTAQNVEYEDDDLSDDDDSGEYVNVMVNRAKLLGDDDYCIVFTTADQDSCCLQPRIKDNIKFAVPKPSKDRSFSLSSSFNDSRQAYPNSMQTNPDFFNFDLLTSRSFENATDLFSTYKYKEELHDTSSAEEETDLTCYPPLCRIWLSSFISNGFWYRLASRIVSTTEITNVLLKLLPNGAVNSNSLKATNNSLWSLWKYGVAVIREGITFLELKYEDNVEIKGEVVGHHKRHKIFLLISIPEFLSFHQKFDSNISLSSKDILSQATKLLVLIEQLILEIGEWFPRTLMEDIFGGVISYAPCCFCLQNKNISKHSSITDADNEEYITIIYKDQQLHCFSFTELLSAYSSDQTVACPHHDKVPVQICAPDIAFEDLEGVACGPNIPLSIDKEKILGRGGCGLVLRGEMIKSRTLVAIKMITDSPLTATIADCFNDNKISTASYQMIRKEVSFLSSLHHENLTQLCGVCTNPFMLLIELAPLGSLRSIIGDYRTANAAISAPVLCQSIKQIASALSFLHQRNVIYFDLKSDNVLVWKYPLPRTKADYSIWLKLTDYGISRVSGVAFEIRTSGANGTVGYIAPEVLLGRNDLQADKIDLFSFGMTIYELLSLQKPFDHLYKINPAVDVNKYISMEKRPELSVKGLWSPYLMQKVMSNCWDQSPVNRPQISQILKWCDLPEFQSLRVVCPLESGKFYAACQCEVNRTHTHVLSSDLSSNVKFTLQHCKEFDRLFTLPDIASPKLDSHNVSDFKKSRYHTQVWISQAVSNSETRLQILTYRSSQVGYRAFTTLIQTARVKSMVYVNHYMWIYTAEQSLFIYHTPTMQNITCIELKNNKSSLIEMVHVPQWNVVIVLWDKSQLWCIHDQVTKSGLHVVNTIELNSKDPVIHLCKVDLPQGMEVWATQGEKEIAIIQRSPDEIHCETILSCSEDKDFLFCYFIICLCFNSHKTGSSTMHVWVSFNRRPHLVCWDAQSRVQINSIVKKGSTDHVTSLLGHENHLYVGTFHGYVTVYDSEGASFLQQFSLHVGKVYRMLELPREVYQCVCAELLLITNREIVRTESLDLSDTSVTPRKRMLQEHTLQQKPVINGNKFHPFTKQHSLDIHSIKAPLIISLGSGTSNWLLNTAADKTEESMQPHLLTWSGYGVI